MKIDLGPARVRGFRFAGASAGLKTVAGALDVGLIVADRPAAAAAVFSANRVKAAPVYVTADRVRAGRLQAIVANSGCANSFTGRAGIRLAEDSCAEVARLLGCPSALVVPSSTGVISHLYDFEKLPEPSLLARQKAHENSRPETIVCRWLDSVPLLPSCCSSAGASGPGRPPIRSVRSSYGLAASSPIPTPKNGRWNASSPSGNSSAKPSIIGVPPSSRWDAAGIPARRPSSGSSRGSSPISFELQTKGHDPSLVAERD